MKKLLMPLVIFSITCFCGCEVLDTEVQQDGVTISLRVDAVGQDNVEIRLTHNGSGEDYWYCMNSDNLTAEASAILERELRTLLREDEEIEANVGINKYLVFKNLKANTKYRAIAARIDVYGRIVGNVAEVTYQTMRDPAVFEEIGYWNMSYKKRRPASEDAETESEFDVFECKVSDNDTTETFVPVIVSKSDFQEVYGGDVRRCFEDYVEFRNSENFKWRNKVSNKSCEYEQERLRSGDYWMFMMGVTKDGVLTGYYSRNSLTLEQEQQTLDYAKWLGVWRLSEKVPSAESIEYMVTINADENNLYLRMTGWENTSKVEEPLRGYLERLPVLLYFEKATGDIFVVSEELADLSTEVEAQFYDFYLYGLVYMGAELSLINLPNIRLARMSMDVNGNVTVTPEKFTYTEDGKAMTARFESFCYTYTTTLWPSLTPMTPDIKVIEIDNLKMEKLAQ